MPIIYNIEPARIDLLAIQGDTIAMNFKVTAEVLSTGVKIRAEAFNVPSLGVPLNMENLHITVKRKDGLILKSWTSIGTPADIVIIADGEFEINDIDGFLESGVFDYDCQVLDSGNTGTIICGSFYVIKRITP